MCQTWGMLESVGWVCTQYAHSMPSSGEISGSRSKKG